MAKEVAKYRADFQHEFESAALYGAQAETEEQGQLARVYERLAVVEEHALLTLLTGRNVPFSGATAGAAAVLIYGGSLLIESVLGQ